MIDTIDGMGVLMASPLEELLTDHIFTTVIASYVIGDGKKRNTNPLIVFDDSDLVKKCNSVN